MKVGVHVQTGGPEVISPRNVGDDTFWGASILIFQYLAIISFSGFFKQGDTYPIVMRN